MDLTRFSDILLPYLSFQDLTNVAPVNRHFYKKVASHIERGEEVCPRDAINFLSPKFMEALNSFYQKDDDGGAYYGLVNQWRVLYWLLYKTRDTILPEDSNLHDLLMRCCLNRNPFKELSRHDSENQLDHVAVTRLIKHAVVVSCPEFALSVFTSYWWSNAFDPVFVELLFPHCASCMKMTYNMVPHCFKCRCDLSRGKPVPYGAHRCVYLCPCCTKILAPYYKIQEERRQKFSEMESQRKWDCLYMDPFCESYNHAGQGCTCRCHGKFWL